MIAHQVGADDVQILAARRVEAGHLGTVALRLQDEILGHQALAQDVALVVDVMQKAIERADALQQPGLDALPFRCGDRPRDEIERENLLDAAAIGIDREGDALVDKDEIGAIAALLELVKGELPEAFG